MSPMIQTKMSEPAWTVPAVSLLMVSLLVVFYAIVSGATKAGDIRRQATATHAAAVMRCNALPSWDASKNCVKSLRSPTAANEPVLLAAQ